MRLPVIFLSVALSVLSLAGFAQITISANQVGFDSKGPKIAVVSLDRRLTRKMIFNLINTANNKVEFSAVLSGPATIDDWTPGKSYYRADFSAFQKAGKYNIS